MLRIHSFLQNTFLYVISIIKKNLPSTFLDIPIKCVITKSPSSLFFIVATEYHLGLLKAKLAKYRSQLLEPSKKSEKGEGFDVLKSGDARVALIGFPSVGKSTLLSTLTHTESEAASYEFTTLTCIPGVIAYKGANIQLLDLPGIIEGAAQVRIKNIYIHYYFLN